MKLKNKYDAQQYVLSRLYSDLSSARIHDAAWLNHAVDERAGELEDITSERLAHAAADEVLTMLHYLAIVAPKTKRASVSVLHIQLARDLEADGPTRDTVAGMLAKHEATIVGEWSRRCQELYAHIHSMGQTGAIQIFNGLIRPLMRLEK